MFFKFFDENMRELCNKDKDKFCVLSYILFNLNYAENYKDLKKNECYFSYLIVREKFDMGANKLTRIMKELENEKIIEWRFKSKSKKVPSIIKFNEFYYYEHQKDGMVGGTVDRMVGEVIQEVDMTKFKRDKEKENGTVDGIVNGTLSKKLYLNKYIYSVFEYWNTKNIIKHKTITKSIEKAIEKAVNQYGEQDIRKAIDTYTEILNSNFYYNHRFTLEKFLKQSNGITEFLEDGSTFINYKADKYKNKTSLVEDKTKEIEEFYKY